MEEYNEKLIKQFEEFLGHLSSMKLKKFIDIEIENIDQIEYSTISQFIEWLKIEDYEGDGMDYFPGVEIN